MARDIAVLVQELQDALKGAETRNEALRKQISDSEIRIAEVRHRAELAEADAQRISERLSTLEHLKEQQYQSLIRELFEVPSRRAARLTMIVAALSIVIGLLASIVGTILTARDTAGTVQSLRREAEDAMKRVQQVVLEEIRQSESRTQSRLAPLSPNYPRLQQIVALLTENRRTFAGYDQLNSVRLVYKFRLVPKLPPTDYGLYLLAFREAGLPPKAIPDDTGTLARWDSDMLALYRSMSAEITAAGSPASEPTAPPALLATHKRKGDDTDYGGWKYSGPTYKAVLEALNAQIAIFEKQQALNSLTR